MSNIYKKTKKGWKYINGKTKIKNQYFFKKLWKNIIARELFMTELNGIRENTLNVIQKYSSFQFDKILKLKKI